MKKMMKSYLVFTSSVYRTVMYVLMPAAMVGICFCLGSRCGEAVREVILMGVALFLIIVEIISDSWLFGGIQARDPERIDYLKTSGQGMKIMRNALSMDLLRKLLASLGVMAVCYLVLRRGGNVFARGTLWVDYDTSSSIVKDMGILLYLALVSYFFSALGTFLSRYGSAVWLNAVIGYVTMTPALFCMCLPGVPEYVLFYDLLFAILSAGISAVAVKLAMKKMEGGYYDK